MQAITIRPNPTDDTRVTQAIEVGLHRFEFHNVPARSVDRPDLVEQGHRHTIAGDVLEQLHRAIAAELVTRPVESAEAFRFLRRWLHHRGVDFTAVLGLSRHTIISWEKERRPVPRPEGALLALLVAEQLGVAVRPLAALTGQQGAGEAIAFECVDPAEAAA